MCCGSGCRVNGRAYRMKVAWAGPGSRRKGGAFNFFRLFRSFVGVRVNGRKERA